VEAITDIISIQHYTSQGIRDGPTFQIGKSLPTQKASIHHNTIISPLNSNTKVKMDMSGLKIEPIPDTLVASSDKTPEPIGPKVQQPPNEDWVIEETPTAHRFQSEAMPSDDNSSTVSPSRKVRNKVPHLAVEPSWGTFGGWGTDDDELEDAVAQRGPVETKGRNITHSRSTAGLLLNPSMNRISVTGGGHQMARSHF
jgi:hypothetical protein